MTHRLRKADLAIALFGFVVAFGVTLTAIIVVRYEASGHAAANPPSSVHVQAGKDGHLTPAVLDRQWVTYSNKSTCADRSGSRRSLRRPPQLVVDCLVLLGQLPSAGRPGGSDSLNRAGSCTISWSCRPSAAATAGS
jgi:hypothetical protein